VLKTDTTSLVAFSSPQTGPRPGHRGHPTIWSRIRATAARPAAPRRGPWSSAPGPASDGTLARAALDTEPDGVVIGTLGAGHLAPAVLDLWAEAADRSQ
jgi:L-asparaginase